MNLFVRGKIKLHSGGTSNWKIECDALTDADWDGLAEMAYELLMATIDDLLPFGEVIGVPRGGLPFARALERIRSHSAPGPRLIVDDVLTTGASIKALMTEPDDIGLVVFARGAPPPRVMALFYMPQAVTQLRDGKHL